MVEDINNLLNSGEVPNLFIMNEKIEICEKILVLDKQRDKTLQVSGVNRNEISIFIYKNSFRPTAVLRHCSICSSKL